MWSLSTTIRSVLVVPRTALLTGGSSIVRRQQRPGGRFAIAASGWTRTSRSTSSSSSSSSSESKQDVSSCATGTTLTRTTSRSSSTTTMTSIPTRHQHDDDYENVGMDDLCQKHMELPVAEFAEGCSFLHQVALGNLREVQQAIRANPSLVNFRDYDRRTALHIAASEGHADLCQILVQQGAKINRSDRWGGSPLDDAHRHRHASVIDYLRHHGAVFGSPSQANNFLTAASEGDVEEVKAFLEYGTADIWTTADYDQRTALHLAASTNHPAVVQVLCQHQQQKQQQQLQTSGFGTSSCVSIINAPDRWGQYPLDDAINANATECIYILKQFGAKQGTTRIRRGRKTTDKNNDDSSYEQDDALLDLMHKYGKIRNGKFSMDWHDVLDLLRGVGEEDVSEPVVRKLFQVADPNGDGLIGTEQFLEHSEVFLGGRPARIILVVGGPGSGKGVLCERLVKECRGVVHLSSGALLRDEVQQGTALGRHVQSIMEKGELVSSAIMVTLMKKRMRDHPGKRIILDGFPRSQENARDLVTLCGVPELALHLDCDDTVLLERILKRGGKIGGDANTTKSATTTMNDNDVKPSSSDVAAASRPDDNFHTALQRIRTYHKYHQLTLDFLKEQKVPIVYLECGRATTPETVWEQLTAIGRLMRSAVQLPPQTVTTTINDDDQSQ